MNMVDLPDGFVSLDEATRRVNTTVNLIAMVVEVLPSEPYPKGDSMVMLNLQDESNVQGNGWPGFSVRIFRRQREELPQVRGPGDIVIMRGVEVKLFKGKVVGLSSSKWPPRTPIICFEASKIIVPDLKVSVMGGRAVLPHSIVPSTSKGPTLAEQAYVIYLRHEAPLHCPHLQISARQAPRAISSIGNKFSLIKDIVPGPFHDISGQVVKIFHSNNVVDLQITDFTENSWLYDHQYPNQASVETGRDGDQFGYSEQIPKKQWQGPFGKLTMTIALWPPHADWARNNVKEGDFVYLSNVRTRNSKMNHLEGVLHQDRNTADRIDIRLVYRGKEVEAIQQRKAEYEKRQALQAGAGGFNVPTKPSAKKREKKKAQKEKERKSLEHKYEDQPSVKVAGNVNQHIRCNYPNARLSTIADIVGNPHLKNRTPSGFDTVLPFVNAKHRTCLRVVDFMPKNLVDFSQHVSKRSYNDDFAYIQSDEEEQDINEESNGWEWAFCLLVEDAMTASNGNEKPRRLPLIVANDGAECLLNMDATDLQKHPDKLEQLREKLFYLWGNLEELKSKGAVLPLPQANAKSLTSLPFECCVEEYGYYDEQLHGSEEKCQRLHRMAGTRIM